MFNSSHPYLYPYQPKVITIYKCKNKKRSMGCCYSCDVCGAHGCDNLAAFALGAVDRVELCPYEDLVENGDYSI
jgi:hypothetical protein